MILHLNIKVAEFHTKMNIKKMQSFMDVYNRADIQCEIYGWWYLGWYDLFRLTLGVCLIMLPVIIHDEIMW